MGSTVFPAPASGGSSLPAFAGAATISGKATGPLWTTSLSAGTYAVQVFGPKNGTNTPLFSFGGTLGTAFTSINPGIYKTGETAYITLTTADTRFTVSIAHKYTNDYYWNNVPNMSPNGGFSTWSTAKGKYLAFAHNQSNSRWYCTTSTDGITWSSSYQSVGNDGSDFGNAPYAIWGNSTIWSVLQGPYSNTVSTNAWYSTDAITWNASTMPTVGPGTAVFYGAPNNYWVATTRGNTTGATVASSTDGITWATRSGNSTLGKMNTCIGGGTAYVAAGDSGAITSSTDAITWVTRTSPITGDNWWQSAYGGGKYVLQGQYGSIMYSTDGTTWTISLNYVNSYPTGPNYVPAWDYGNRHFLHDGTKFIGVTSYFGANGTTVGYPLFFSTDAVTWAIAVNPTGMNNTTYEGLGGGMRGLFFLNNTSEGLTAVTFSNIQGSVQSTLKPQSAYINIYPVTASSI